MRRNGKLFDIPVQDRREETRWLTLSASLPVQACLAGSWERDPATAGKPLPGKHGNEYPPGHPSWHWVHFLRVLHGAWRESTGLANWASHTLARLDCVRLPDMTELPPWQPVDLYALAFGRERPSVGRQFYRCCECAKKFSPCHLQDGCAPAHDRGKKQPVSCAGVGQPVVALERPVLPAVTGQYGGDGWTGCKLAAAGLLRTVQRKYLRERGEVLWRRERRTPEFLYPYPFPVAADAWEVYSAGHNRDPILLAALPGGRVSLRLRQGPHFARAVKLLRRVEEGELTKQELKLCRQRTCWDGARQDIQQQPGGRSKDSYRIMVRFSLRVEAATLSQETGIATVATGRDPFLTLTVAGSHQWLHHGLQAQRWLAEHRRFLDAFADEEKFERRSARQRRAYNRHREDRCEKHARRMDTFHQQLAAQAVRHAKRNGCGTVRYDDTDRSFAAEYPWYDLAAKFAYECEEQGLVYVTVGQ